MAEKNTTQNLITAFSIIVALAAVAYALMMHVEKPGDHNAPVTVMEQSEQAFNVTDENPVVMTINGDDVTRVEVLNNFMRSGSQLPPGMPLDRIFPLLQEQYLVGQLIINAAKDRGIDENHPQVQAALQQALDNAIRAAYIEEVGQEAVTDADIRQAYDDIVTNAPSAMERRARHILVETPEAANALIIRLEQGADFAKLAEENSTGPTAERGGDLGYFTKDQMVPEFAEAAFDIAVGTYTKQPVQTQFGYHVILVEDERERPKPAFEEVRDQLASQLRQAATQEAIQNLREQTQYTMFDLNGNEIAPVTEESPASGDTASSEETSDVIPEAESQTEDQSEGEADAQ